MTQGKGRVFKLGQWLVCATLLGLGVAVCYGGDATAPKDGTIAYVVTSLHWATYQTKDGKQECPQGFNEGPREQFKSLFPDDGAKRTLEATQIRRETESWFPTTAPDLFPFRDAGGSTTLGMNLDGKVGPQDFTSPDGEPGIDNQLYRALGCINSYRGGPNDFFDNDEITKERYNRWLLVLTGVDSLVNDDDVQVTLVRGMDPVLTDATGSSFMAGGTQALDLRWGARFVQRVHGRIENGTLVTETADFTFPWATFNVPADEYMRAARFRLKLSPTAAEGMIGGYADIETWYLQTMKSESTHHQSYGQLSPPSLYKAFRHFADAYPDPKTGENTAISSALLAKFVQVYVLPSSLTTLATYVPQQSARPYAGTPYPRPAEEEARVAHATVPVANASP
jgi:hypothetical protein